MRKIVLLFLVNFACLASLYAQSMDLATLLKSVENNPNLAKSYGLSADDLQRMNEVKSKLGNFSVASSTKKENSTVVIPATDSLKNQAGSKPAIVVFNRKGADNFDSLKSPTSIIFGQDYFRNNKIELFTKTSNSKAPDNYLLDAGDELSVSIWGNSELNEVYRIDQEGYIQPTNVGRIYLKGLSYKDVRDMMTKRFSSVYDLSNSKLAIKLNYTRTINVNIVGEVFYPGSYTIPAMNTAFNALFAAKGPTDLGSVRTISISRAGKTIKELDLYEFLLHPTSNQDFYLQDNDYIIVHPIEKIVEVAGEIRRPAIYELKKQDGLNELLQFAGGTKSTAFLKSFHLNRYDKNRKLVLNIPYEELVNTKMPFALMDGDEIIINRISDEVVNFVSIEGEVNVPDTYEITRTTRISEIIAKAGGLSYNAYKKQAFLIRLQEDLTYTYFKFNLDTILSNPNASANLLLKPFDQIKIFAKSRFTDSLMVAIHGAVRRPGIYTYGNNMTLNDLMYFAGGLKTEASNNRIEIARILSNNAVSGLNEPTKVIIKTIKINSDLSIENMEDKFVLQPYDEVYIRNDPDFEYQRNVLINGEVKFPGLYSMASRNEKVVDLITRAGGLTNFAFVAGATLKRKDDKLGLVILDLKQAIAQPESKFNYILKSGDEIIIPKINELISVSGAIRFSGIDSLKKINTPYFANRRAGYYINNFVGGFEENANKRQLLVLDANGRIRRTHSFVFINFYPKVELGSKIVVPFKENRKDKDQSNPINWNQAFENFTIKATGIITFILIVSNISKISKIL